MERYEILNLARHLAGQMLRDPSTIDEEEDAFVSARELIHFWERSARTAGEVLFNRAGAEHAQELYAAVTDALVERIREARLARAS